MVTAYLNIIRRISVISIIASLPSCALASTADELAKSSWSFALFIAGTLLTFGYLIDQMFGWLWTEKISKSLLKRSNAYLDMHFLPLIHDDLVVAQQHLRRIFGENLISIGFFGGSFAVLFAYSLVGIAVEAVSRGVAIDIVGVLAGFVMALFASICNVTSLATTQWLLSRASPSVLRLSSILTLDLVVAYITMGLPWWFGGSLVLFDEGVSVVEWFNATFVKYIFIWPFSIWSGFITHNDFTFQAWFNFFGVILMCFGSVLPSLFHGYLILRDILRLAIFRWFYLGAAGLFANLAVSKQPVTVVLGAFGAFIPLAKLFSEALPWISNVLFSGA